MACPWGNFCIKCYRMAEQEFFCIAANFPVAVRKTARHGPLTGEIATKTETRKP